MKSNGLLIAVIVCCACLFIGGIITAVLYWGNFTCPNFGSDCSATGTPTGTPANSPTGTPAGTPARTPTGTPAGTPARTPASTVWSLGTGCGIGQHLVNNVCTDCPVGYTTASFGSDTCIATTPGQFRSLCTADTQCSDGLMCCMGSCGDHSFCDSKCGKNQNGEDQVFNNQDKICMTLAAYRARYPPAARPLVTYAAIGEPCNTDDNCETDNCTSGVCQRARGD